jgi:uncharacterized membrane protein
VPVRFREIAGGSLERLTALSDGIFAVAMTILVLGLTVQTAANPHLHGAQANRAVWDDVLRPLWPHLLTYLMSFLTLGVFWVGQQTQLHHMRGTNRDLSWIHLLFLLCVSLMPFSTMLVADYITSQLAIVVYWLNILLLGAVLFASQRYAGRAGLFGDDVTVEVRAAMRRRIVIYQGLYAVGVLLCLVSTYASIGFIVVVQLNAAITPRIWPLDRF